MNKVFFKKNTYDFLRLVEYESESEKKNEY